MEAPEPHRTNPCVFIVGCPRSGTTPLQRMINTHPQIAITPETHWIPRVYKKRGGLTAEGLVTPELISHLLELPKFRRLGTSRDELVELNLLKALIDTLGGGRAARSKAVAQ